MNVKHLDKLTTNGTVRNLKALYQLFPSCFTEAPNAIGEVHLAVNWQKLRALLGEYVEDGEPEVYDFSGQLNNLSFPSPIMCPYLEITHHFCQVL